MDTIRISPSKLGLGYLCPSSVVRVPDALSADSPPARFGRAGHSVMRWLMEHDGELPDLKPYRERYAIGDDEANDFNTACEIARHRLLEWTATLPPQALASVECEVDTPLIEVEAAGHTFTIGGTMDVRTTTWNGAGEKMLDSYTIHILDYKLGHVESAQAWAAQTLAYLACEMFGKREDDGPDRPPIDDGTATIIFFGDGSRQTWRASREEVLHWLREFEGDVLKYYGRFSPGAHCGRCDRAVLPPEHPLFCPHAYKEVGLFLSALGAGTALDLRPGVAIANETVADRLLLARMVAKQAAALVERIREVVSASPGERMPLGDGRYLGFRTKPRREIRPLVGLPVLLGFASPDDIEPAVQVSKSAAVEAIKARMEKDEPKRPRGWKAALEREVDSGLEAAGAFRETTIRELGIYQDQEQEKEIGDGKATPAAGV